MDRVMPPEHAACIRERRCRVLPRVAGRGLHRCTMGGELSHEEQTIAHSPQAHRDTETRRHRDGNAQVLCDTDIKC
eukprot:117741-Rhodomonas_salina.2